MDTKLKAALAEYGRACRKVYRLKFVSYPRDKVIHVKGYGEARVIGNSDSPGKLLVRLSSGYILNIFIADILPPKKAKVTK